MEERIILVDENDHEIGSMEKLEAHEKGLLHRAFSVFLFNSRGELLLQQRADEKYHSAGLWSNTCCSHPNYGEELPDAISRKLHQELNLEAAVTFQFKFTYKAALENELWEHEIDHVYFGSSDRHPIPNRAEVKDWKYISMDKLERELKSWPERYSQWLAICFPMVKNAYQANYSTLIK